MVIRWCLLSKDSENPVYQKDHKKLANEFNEYFASVGKIAADKVKRLAEVMTDSSMLGLELPLRRLLHCRTEFLQALFYRRFYLIYTQIACLQFPTVVILDRMLTIRKHFYRFHCHIWNNRYCI